MPLEIDFSPNTSSQDICSVRIQCQESQGELQVHMDYQGDPITIAFLLEDALKILHDRLEQEENTSHNQG